MIKTISIFGLIILLGACGGKKNESDSSNPLDELPVGRSSQNFTAHEARQCPNLRGSYRLRSTTRRSYLIFAQDFRGELTLIGGDNQQQQLPIDGRPHGYNQNTTVVTASCADGKISVHTRVNNGLDRYTVIAPRMVGVIGITITDFSQSPPAVVEYDRGF